MQLRREAEALLAERKGETQGGKKNGVGSKGTAHAKTHAILAWIKNTSQPSAAAAARVGQSVTVLVWCFTPVHIYSRQLLT